MFFLKFVIESYNWARDFFANLTFFSREFTANVPIFGREQSTGLFVILVVKEFSTLK